MPIYHYAPLKKPCKICDTGFDLRQPAAAAPLQHCPTCGQPVTRQVAAASTPRITAPLSKATAKQSGFTILKRTCDGNFEKQ